MAFLLLLSKLDHPISCLAEDNVQNCSSRWRCGQAIARLKFVTWWQELGVELYDEAVHDLKCY